MLPRKPLDTAHHENTEMCGTSLSCIITSLLHFEARQLADGTGSSLTKSQGRGVSDETYKVEPVSGNNKIGS